MWKRFGVMMLTLAGLASAEDFAHESQDYGLDEVALEANILHSKSGPVFQIGYQNADDRQITIGLDPENVALMAVIVGGIISTYALVTAANSERSDISSSLDVACNAIKALSTTGKPSTLAPIPPPPGPTVPTLPDTVDRINALVTYGKDLRSAIAAYNSTCTSV